MRTGEFSGVCGRAFQSPGTEFEHGSQLGQTRKRSMVREICIIYYVLDLILSLCALSVIFRTLLNVLSYW